MKKSKLLLCAITVLFFLVCMPTNTFAKANNSSPMGTGPALFAEEKDKDVENDAFTVTVDPGLDGVVVEGKSMPVTVTVGNFSGVDVSGILRITLPSTYDHNSLAYERAVAIPNGGEKSISFLLPKMDTSFIRVELENERKKILFSIQEKPQILTVGQNAVVGILSNDYSGLNYFDGAAIDTISGITSAKIIQLTADNIPETGEGLSTCHYILIDQYNTSQLSEKQRNAIAAWVSNGGMLILGTGSKASVVLEGFQDSLCPLTPGELTKQDMTLMNSVNGETKSVDSVALNQAGVAMQDAGWQDVEGGIATGGSAWLAGYGAGTVLVLSYDLAMEPITSWNEKGILAANILANAGNEDIYDTMLYGGVTQYNYDGYQMEESVRGVDRNKVPNPLLYAGVYLVYVICIGPVAYLILKAKDKREKMWLVMPVIAFGFTIVVFATSMLYRIHKPFIGSVAIVEYSNGPINTRNYMSVRSPKGKEYVIDFADGYQSMQTWADDYMGYSNVGTTDYTCAVRQEGTAVSLYVKQTKAFEEQNLMTQKEEFQVGSGFATNLTCDLSGFEGTITNNTGYDLQNVVACYNEQYIFVGAMKDGETATLERKQLSSLNNVYYDMEQWMEKLPNDMPFLVNSEEAHALKDNQNIYKVMESRANQLSINQGMIFGMIENYDDAFVKKNNVKTYSAAVAVSYFNQVVEEYQNSSFILDDINMYMVGGDHVPYTSDYPLDFDYFYDTEDLDMYGEEEKEVLYDFGTLNLKGAMLLNLNYIPEDLTGDTGDSGEEDDLGDVYDNIYGDGVQYCKLQLYNYTTGAYEDAFVDGTVEDLTPYLNEQNWMQIRYYTDDADAWNCYAPQLYLVGGED